MAVIEENTCAFYASDYHLEMIMLPYINKNFKENKNIYIFTQNNLEETINTVVDKINLKQDTKQNIFDIDWKNDDENKYNKLIKDKKEAIIFIKGNENYIEKVNNNLNEIKQFKKIEIVDCYNIDEVGKKASNILKKHKSVLVTNDIK